MRSKTGLCIFLFSSFALFFTFQNFTYQNLAPVNLAIDYAQTISFNGGPLSVNPMIMGMNLDYFVTDKNREALVPLLKGKIKTLRWPGGAEISMYSFKYPNYNPWKDPRRAYNPAYNLDPALFTDIYEAADFAHKIGAELIVGVPMQTGFWSSVGQWDTAATSYKSGDDKGKPAVWRTYDQGGPAKEAADVVTEIIKKKKLGIKYFYIDNELGFNGNDYYNRFGRPISADEASRANKEIVERMKAAAADKAGNSNIEVFANSKNKNVSNWWSFFDIPTVDGQGETSYWGRWDEANPVDYQKDFLDFSFSSSNLNLGQSILSTNNSYLNWHKTKSFNFRYEWNMSKSYGNISHFEACLINGWNLLEQAKGAMDISTFWPLYNGAGYYPNFASTAFSYVDFKTEQLGLSGYLVEMVSDQLGLDKGNVVLSTQSAQDVYIFAAKNENQRNIKVTLINKNPNVASSVVIDTKNFKLSDYKEISAYSFQPKDGPVNMKNDSKESFSVNRTAVQVDTQKMTLTLIVPPASITSINLENPIGVVNNLVSDQNRAFTFPLPSRISLRRLVIDTPDLRTRNYSVQVRLRGNDPFYELVGRQDQAGEVVRNHMVENFDDRPISEIKIVWQGQSPPPSQISVSYYGDTVRQISNPSTWISDENSGMPSTPETYIVDNDWNTIWSSNDLKWSYLKFGLGSQMLVKGLNIRWEYGATPNYALNYDIMATDVVDHNPQWDEFYIVKTVTGGDGGDDFVGFDIPVKTKFLRLVFKDAPAGATNFKVREVFLYGN